MGNWLSGKTADLCTQVNAMGLILDNMKKDFTESNDTYYSAAQNVADPGTFQGKGAQAFLMAVNADVNRLRPLVDGLGHLSSACDVLSSSISQASSTYDSKIAAIADSPQVPSKYIPAMDGYPQVPSQYFDNWREELLSNFFAEANLVYGPYTGNDAMSAFLQQGRSAIETPMYGVVQSVATWTVDRDAEAYAEQIINNYHNLHSAGTDIPQASGDPTADIKKQVHDNFNNAYADLHKAISTNLENWADELHSAYKTFQSVIQNPDGYLSARDIYDLLYYGSLDGSYTDGSQGTNSPITITPYTTTDGKKGLLITLGGTDMGHLTNDDNILAALDTGEGLPTAYLVEIHNALDTYMINHPGMEGSELTLAGYSLGGMQAQIVAKALNEPNSLIDNPGAGNFNDLVTHYGLHVANVVTYGSPIMGAPATGVNYTMYDAVGDPVPLLSSYENPLFDKLKGTLAKLGTDPKGAVGQLVAQGGLEYKAYCSLIDADQLSWQDKVNQYIDPNHQHQHIYALTDVGNTSIGQGHPRLLALPDLGAPWTWWNTTYFDPGHQINIDNHMHYYQSAQLNVGQSSQLTSNLKIDPSSLGPTEYFSIVMPDH
jgi:hypothetical protein